MTEEQKLFYQLKSNNRPVWVTAARKLINLYMGRGRLDKMKELCPLVLEKAHRTKLSNTSGWFEDEEIVALLDANELEFLNTL